LTDGDLRHAIDFRSVYATVLDKWLGADPSKILGSNYDRVAFI
ncbi:MAG: twin-arginine translocation pathway signal, partial [Armatimonadetes bacterium]|nr:twin-arginine translocation pathway signal [Armatimonadota bacterium]